MLRQGSALRLTETTEPHHCIVITEPGVNVLNGPPLNGNVGTGAMITGAVLIGVMIGPVPRNPD